MANTKITELTALTQCAATDVLPIVKVSANTTKKVSISDLLRNAPAGTAGAPSIANADDQDTGILFPAANSVGISTGGTQRLVIDSSGRVGIGATPTTDKLEIAGNIRFSGVDNYIKFANDLVTIKRASNRLDFNSYNGFRFYDTLNSTERLRIDSSGRLLVGTTTEGFSSADDLTIATTGDTGITIRSGTSNQGNIFFSDGTSGNSEYRGAIRYYHDVDELEFMTAASGRLRIDSSGNLGVGDSSPDARCVVYRPTQFSGNTVFAVKSDAGSTKSTKFMVDGDGNVGINASSPGRTLDVDGVIRSDGTSGAFELGGNSSTPSVGCAIHRPANNTMAFVTGTNERMRITSTGQMRLAGAGITFNGDTAIANELDDYEEGTYSAQITMGSGSVTMNTSYDTLAYTKIGRLVVVTGQIRVSSVSSPGGGFSLNLPFAVRNNISDARGGVVITKYATASSPVYTLMGCQFAESTSTINSSTSFQGYVAPAAADEYAITASYITDA